MPVPKACRKMGIVEQTFYHWRRNSLAWVLRRFGGLRFWKKNKKLKQVVADLSLDKHMLQGEPLKNALGLLKCGHTSRC